jgi:hypothetical protein
VTHPELKATFHLDILGVKKNPQSPLYTTLGVLTKGTEETRRVGEESGKEKRKRRISSFLSSRYLASLFP